jgi:hypothetical protein
VRESDFAELGANASAYFKLTKMLALTYLVLAALAAPLVVINLNGGNDSATAVNLLASTTLGNVAGVNGTNVLQLPLVGQVRIGSASVFYALLDLLVVAVVTAAYFWAKDFAAREAKQVNRLSKTLMSPTRTATACPFMWLPQRFAAGPAQWQALRTVQGGPSSAG